MRGCQGTYDLAGHAAGQAIRWDVGSDDTARRNDGACANPHAFQDGHVGTEPDIVLDHDWCGKSATPMPSVQIIDGMKVGVENIAIHSDQNIISNSNVLDTKNRRSGNPDIIPYGEFS